MKLALSVLKARKVKSAPLALRVRKDSRVTRVTPATLVLKASKA